MDQGKRYENMSWRLWNRETFCCNAKQARSASSSTSSLAPQERCSFTHETQAATRDMAVPALSSSLDSLSSEEDVEELVETESTGRCARAIPKARPELNRAECTPSGSPSERHITGNALEKIIAIIQDTPDIQDVAELHLPLSASTSTSTSRPAPDPPAASAPSIQLSTLPIRSQHALASSSSFSNDSTPQPSSSQPTSISASRSTLLESSASTVGTHDDDAASQTVGSEGSSNTEVSMDNQSNADNHSVVRGFNIGGAPSSYRSQTNLAQPTPILKKPSPSARLPPKKRGGAMFTIGTSSGEEESSLESHMYKSSLSESLKKSHGSLGGPSSRKQTSFKDEVAIGRAAEHSPVFESDDEDDEVSESAIEDEDDSSDWEDSEDQQSGPSSVNETYFQRVDSRPQLTSRRSMLTSLMHEPDRAKALQNAASRSTPAMRRSRTSTPNGPSLATSPAQHAQLQVPEQEGPRARPIIMTTSNTHQQQLALSPRTTRRNMLSTELTESLRKNLLWERQHRSTGNLAAMKRRHTSNDVKNLKQHPEPAPILSHGHGKKPFNNDYFNAGLGEYHAKGW